MSVESILGTMTRREVRPIELGKIKIGGLGKERTARNGRKYRMPVKDDCFTVTGFDRDEKGNLTTDERLMDELLTKYGVDIEIDGKVVRKLRQIPIMLLSDDIDDIIRAEYAFYGSTACGARSDGKTVWWYRDPATGNALDPIKEEPFTPELLKRTIGKGNAPMFKLHTTFSCAIATEHAKFGGVYRFRTTSVISFRQLTESLTSLSQLTGGILTGLPFWLVVRPMQVKPDSGTTTVHVVHIEARGSEIKAIQQQAMAQAAYNLKFHKTVNKIRAQYKLLSHNESPSEQVAIAREYSPDSFDEYPDVIDDVVDDDHSDIQDVPLDDLLEDAGEREVTDRSTTVASDAGVTSESPTETLEQQMSARLRDIADATSIRDVDMTLASAMDHMPSSACAVLIKAANERKVELEAPGE